MNIGKKQKILFLDSLASLLNAGIPVIQGLSIVLFQTKNKKIIQIVNTLKSRIIAGDNFYKIALTMPKVFNSFDRAMIETGEATGKIGQAIETIVSKEEKEYDLNKKVKQALIYPISIVVVMIIMITIIMTYVIPKIEGIYKESNVTLPQLTQIVINISHFFVNYGIFLFIGIIILGIGAKAIYSKISDIKYTIDSAILDLPIFGEIIKKKILIHFTDFLSTLLSSGITINNALVIIKNATDNEFYKRILEKVGQEVKSGLPISSAMGVEIMNNQNINSKKTDLILKNKAFPIELSTSVKIGEQTGSLSKMLIKTSERYTKEIDNTIKNLSTMLEPIIIVFIGVIVGTIIMAILLPFLNIVNVIK